MGPGGASAQSLSLMAKIPRYDSRLCAHRLRFLGSEPHPVVWSCPAQELTPSGG
jgi:hypothetical protein